MFFLSRSSFVLFKKKTKKSEREKKETLFCTSPPLSCTFQAGQASPEESLRVADTCSCGRQSLADAIFQRRTFWPANWLANIMQARRQNTLAPNRPSWPTRARGRAARVTSRPLCAELVGKVCKQQVAGAARSWPCKLVSLERLRSRAEQRQPGGLPLGELEIWPEQSDRRFG